MLTVLLLWAAFTAATLTAWLILGFLAVTTLHLTRQAAIRRHYRRAVRHVGEDTLDVLIRAALADGFGPGADTPVPYLPAETADVDAWEPELAEGSGG